MTFTKELIEETADYEITSEGKLVKNYHEKYLCKNPTYITTDQVYTDAGITFGSAYRNYHLAFTKKVKIDRLFHKDDPNHAWHADYDYSTDVVQFAENPIDRPTKRKIYSTEVQRVIFRDADGQIILNAAGDPPDGGVPVNHHMPTMSWERNEDSATFDIPTFSVLSGKVNSDTFAGFDPGQLLLVASSDESWESTYHFWKSSYVMYGNNQGWQPQFVNAGYFKKIYTTSGGTTTVSTKRITGDDGQPVDEPQPLYGFSNPKPGSLVPIANRPDDCNYIKVTYNGSIAFSSLNLSLT